MARTLSQYHCQSCGAVSAKWSGRCEACGEWNTLTEERLEAQPGKKRKTGGRAVDLVPLAESEHTAPARRLVTGIDEFDRVTGGGLVAGSAILIGGDPGIGKSTLLLQLVCKLAAAGRKAAYITGEESAEQVRMRAMRLGVMNSPTTLAPATNAIYIAESVRRMPHLD